MTREEEKIKASKEYAKKHPYIYYSDLEEYDYDDADAIYDFKAPARIFAKGIDWADSHPVNQWHKVEDGLPPVDKYRGYDNFSIETLFTDGKYMFVGIYSFKSKMWIDRDYCFPTGRITHWMELPELPKEE